MASRLAVALRSSSIKWAAGGWTFFILENAFLSENRSWLIEQLGDDVYHYLYGTISTAALSSVGFAYFRKVRNVPPLLWPVSQAPTMQSKIISWVYLSLGLTMASQALPKMQLPVHLDPARSTKDSTSLKVRCPFDFADNNIGSQSTVCGLERVSRHAGLWSFAFIGVGHSCLLPSIPQRIWWSMPFWVALVGGSHTDSRYRRHIGGTLDPEYDSITSNIPFVAMLTGRQGNISQVCQDLISETKPLNALVATGIATIWVVRRGRGGIPKLSVNHL